MGLEILGTGNVNVFRSDREELLGIRNGQWSYDKLVTYAEDMDKKIGDLYETTPLPHGPDLLGLEVLCEKIIKEFFNFKEF